MTEAEALRIVERLRHREAFVGVDRTVARRVYTDIPLATITDLTGETPYLQKAIVWCALLAGLLALMAACVSAVATFEWWAFLVVPICLLVWCSYFGDSCRGGARMGYITLMLLSVACSASASASWLTRETVFALTFVFALWCARFVYCSATAFLRAFVARNHRALAAFGDSVQIRWIE